MDFGEAVKSMKRGLHVARSGWNGKNMWIALQRPDSNSKMTLPYIYMFTAQCDLVPWLANQTDILSDDWSVVATDAETILGATAGKPGGHAGFGQ